MGNPDKGRFVVAQASAIKRLMAFLVDILVIDIVVLFPLNRIFESAVPKAESFSKTIKILSSADYGTMLTFVMISVSVMAMLYFIVLEKKLGQTAGKMFFNLYVMPREKELKYWQLFVRSMFLLPLFPFVLLWIADPIVMFFNKDGQRLSEMLSRTSVVEKYYI